MAFSKITCRKSGDTGWSVHCKSENYVREQKTFLASISITKVMLLEVGMNETTDKERGTVNYKICVRYYCIYDHQNLQTGAINLRGWCFL
jgi:hypothetical protein